jgi:hypothetical protein
VWELALRFAIGGLVVCAFSVLGDVFRPQHFAGIFGAAPSVALASLTLAMHQGGGALAAADGRAMVAGAVALLVYNFVLTWMVLRRRYPALGSACGVWLAWFATAFGLWGVFLR